jgi:hypothetical protein
MNEPVRWALFSDGIGRALVDATLFRSMEPAETRAALGATFRAAERAYYGSDADAVAAKVDDSAARCRL